LNQSEFYRYSEDERKGRLYTADQYAEAYLSIQRVIREYGMPIPLVQAVKLAAERDSKVKEFYDVDEYTSEDDPSLWELIYQIVGDGPPYEGGLVPVEIEPKLVVIFVKPRT
jgi:hypothetical protein